jgi:hypothetical protein
MKRPGRGMRGTLKSSDTAHPRYATWPSARRRAALANATDPFFKSFLEKIQLGGEVTQTTINAVRVKSSGKFEAAFTARKRWL